MVVGVTQHDGARKGGRKIDESIKIRRGPGNASNQPEGSSVKDDSTKQDIRGV